MTMDLGTCPGLPLGDDNAPVFAEPWMAQAFAMVLTLHQRGLFSWPEWAEALSAAIARAPWTMRPVRSRTRAIMVRRLSCVSFSPWNSCPISSRVQTSMEAVRSPSAIRRSNWPLSRSGFRTMRSKAR